MHPMRASLQTVHSITQYAGERTQQTFFLGGGAKLQGEKSPHPSKNRRKTGPVPPYLKRGVNQETGRCEQGDYRKNRAVKWKSVKWGTMCII